MITFVNLLVRRDGLSHEEFLEWWTGPHADIARELPGLRAYRTAVPTDVEKSPYDGFVELTFDDMGALGESFDSSVGKEVQADAAEYVDMERSQTMIVEKTDQLDGFGRDAEVGDRESADR